MKKLLTKITMILFLPIAALCSSPAKVVEVPLPKEMFVFEMPKEEKRNWEIGLSTVSEYIGVLEITPEDQKVSESSPQEMLVIGFYGPKDSPVTTINKIIEKRHESLLQKFPDSEHLVKVIQKTEKDLIVECIAFSNEKGNRLVHEIIRYHLTPTGTHFIKFSCCNLNLTPEKRTQWLEAIRDQASIRSQNEILLMDSQAISFKLIISK